MINLFAVSLTLVATVIGAFGAIFLKKGSARISLSNFNLIFGIFLYGVSTIIYIAALKKEQLSVLYPVISLGYVWVCLLSVGFLKEKMNFWKWAGIATIIFGVSLIGFGC